MFSRKHTTKTVIQVTDTHLTYITLNYSKQGFFISKNETVELPEGTILRGEILKADLLYRILKKLAQHIENTSVDIVLSHDYFLCAEGDLDTSSSHKTLKKRVADYFKNESKKESWHRTHVCEFSYHEVQGREKLLFKCLPKDVQQSYIHVFQKAGMKIQSLSSDILAFDHVLPYPRASLIVVGQDTIRVAEFKQGMYVSHKTFQVSYHQCIQDIMNTLTISETAAQKILRQYGILRAHKDEKVYRRLLKSFSPLLEFLSARKIKETSSMFVSFFDVPIKGLVDTLQKTLSIEVQELDVLATDHYTFQDILALHRDESYQYQALIAQALKHWRKE